MKKFVIITIILLIFQLGTAVAHNQNYFSINSTIIKDNSNYIIITTSELEDSLNDFKIWKEHPGLYVKIVNITWISTNYNGMDIQEKIRNFLIDKYEDWNIKYVLIVGSRDTIPMRRCDPINWEYGDFFYTDYYYSDITGNWDNDKDGIYAEYNDDNIDFIPEISIGRIPSDNKDSINKILQNIMAYESDDGPWKKNVLMLAAISYYQGLESFGWTYDRSDCATIMEECLIDIFEPKGFNCVRMYEAEGLRPSLYNYEYPLEHLNVLSEWRKNYSIVNMIGHSNENLAARWIWDHDDGDNIPEVEKGELIYKDILTKSDSQVLSLEKPPIVFSGGCSQLHGSNNMGRSFIENNAAVAYIGTTDLGFYNITRIWNDESDGGFGSIDYYFFYYLITHNQSCGDALSNSKIYFYNHFMFNDYNPEWIYRCYSTLMGTTLYGDPSLHLLPISTPPSKPSTPYGSTSGKVNKEYTFSTKCNDFNGDQIRYLFDWGDGNKTITDYYPSNKTVNVTYAWIHQGTFNITVRAQDEFGIWSEWSEPLPVKMPINVINKKFNQTQILDNIYQKLLDFFKLFN